MTLSPSQRRLVEHVGGQRGFELLIQADERETKLASSLVPGTLSVTTFDQGFMVRVDLPAVMNALVREFGNAAGGGVIAGDENDLYMAFGRAFQLCRSLPDHPLREYEQKTSGLPRETEEQRLVLQRIGQDVFRKALEDYWEGRCAVTGLRDRDLLRASHINPWAESSDTERLDVYNGILLAAHLDAAFDKHLVTFSENGELMLSTRRLSPDAIGLLNPGAGSLRARLCPQHQSYLELHRRRFLSLEAEAA